jgi:toxin-antitoxin system PIN domain toxin
VILPDVNVLIYAFRKDAPYHEVCNSWLNAIVQTHARFGISALALAAVIRVTTDRRVYAMPSTPSEAFGFADFLLSQPHCVLVEPRERHWELFTRLCVETNTTGRRVTDAWYAALAIEWGCEWVTFDRDYTRFPGLKWQVPTAG